MSEQKKVSYGADQIQVLEGLEAVRKRPGMYIGSTSLKGLHHLVYEVVDNSIDEALAGYCTHIEVTIEEDNSITVVDNGRGIPVAMHKIGKPAVEVVLTVLHAGGKFGGDGYPISGGLHGVGISVVNALSEQTEIEVKRDGFLWKISFARGLTVNSLEKVRPLEEGEERGTKVWFKPDSEIFPDTVYDFETLKIRLRELAFLNKGLTITLADKRTDKKEIYYYEEEMQIHTNGIMLCKKSLGILLNAIEQNNHAEIMKAVDGFYEEMRERGIAGEVMRLNINYLLFQLLHLASELDDSVNQEEILRMISEGTFEAGILRGSKAHLCRVACEYGDYLAQMRKDSSRGILGKVEKEIRERYAENLTLKEFGEKYYLNGAYLGQLFRKKFGQSFKDYLNNCRIEQACHLLLRTDKKIYQIAEMVGYRDLDYFVNRFISVKGCTPAKFRKQAKTKDEKKGAEDLSE